MTGPTFDDLKVEPKLPSVNQQYFLTEPLQITCPSCGTALLQFCRPVPGMAIMEHMPVGNCLFNNTRWELMLPGIKLTQRPLGENYNVLPK